MNWNGLENCKFSELEKATLKAKIKKQTELVSLIIKQRATAQNLVENQLNRCRSEDERGLGGGRKERREKPEENFKNTRWFPTQQSLNN